DQRLITHRRGIHSAEELLRAATKGGADALGWDTGELRVGALADFVSLETESPRLAGGGDRDILSRIVYAAAPSDVRTVVVGGKTVVSSGRHLRLGGVGSLLAQALEALEAT
ncbi:MAG: amidohydrolase family protein, partial [Candidatus Dormibacteria bacterium]